MKNLVWLLFLPGFLCYPDPLEIKPNSLDTWEGSCVLIPCQIGNYNGFPLRILSLLWYFQPLYDENQKEYSGRILYNSSLTSRNYGTRLQSASAARQKFVGNLEKKNCSLKISPVRAEDDGTYGARLTASYGQQGQRALRGQQSQEVKWFLNATVNVAESPPDPKMDIIPKYNQESWTTVTCSIQYHCPEEPLRLTISGLAESRLSSQRMTIDNGEIKTVVGFQASWEDHGKSLVCSLTRQNGSEISKTTMWLDVKYVPKEVQLKPWPGKTVREGETLFLECTIKSSNPKVSGYLWYKDDKLMYEWQNHPKIDFETEGDKHSGAYSCGAQNIVGTQKSKELFIDVQYPPKEVKVERWPQEGIKEGERMVVRCSSKGNPPITRYEWYKLPQTAVFRNSEEFTFQAIQLENAGTYYCVANNSLGSAKSSQYTLNVLYAPKGVQLTIENSQLPIRERDTVTLNCSFNHSNPRNPIWYKWYRGRTRLSFQGNLLIVSATLDQAGDYRCDVCNNVGCISSQKVIVDIHFAPKGVRVVQESRNPIREGNQVNLRCDVKDANPKADSYRWYKDGVQQRSDSAAAELIISHVTSEHSGRYSCEATNTVATSRSPPIVLDVYYGPRKIHLSMESQMVVTEGMDVSLLCAADANPPPRTFELYRDGEKLLESADQILLLQKIQIKDSGDYHCKARNTVSTGESPTLTLSVSYSRATKLKHGMKGLGLILSLIFVLGVLIFAVRAWKKKKGPRAAKAKGTGSFFVRKPKPEQLCHNRAHEGVVNSLAFQNEGAEEAVSYAVLRFPAGVSEEQDDYARVNAPRIALDPSHEEVVYSVVKKPGPPHSKGDTRHDYENVVAQKEEELHYSSLVNLAPRPRPTYRDSETDSESEESIQYAALKH